MPTALEHVHMLYDEFFETMNDHFKKRSIIIRLTGEEEIGERTRTFQHFTMKVHPNPLTFMERQPEDLEITYKCKYRIESPYTLYIELGADDPFHGAADSDPKRGMYIHKIDDIIRSFCHYSPHFRCATFSLI